MSQRQLRCAAGLLLCALLCLALMIDTGMWVSTRQMSPRVAGSRPPSCARSSCVDSTKPKWGMRLHDHPSGRVTLSGVKRESPAQKAGLRKGDIIMELSDRGVFTAQQAADLLAVVRACMWNGILVVWR